MQEIITSKNLKVAGALVIVNYIASALTAGQNKWVQGGAMFVATAAALPFALSKLGK